MSDTQTLPLEIAPIGHVRSSIEAPSVHIHGQGADQHIKPHTHRFDREHKSEIVLDSQWEELLDGIEGYSHIMVLYWPHLLSEERRKIRKVHPMGRTEIPLQGIFATRSPARPNPILVSVVKLLERKGNVLYLQGLEAVDGSPVLDIKPHNRTFDMVTEEVRVPDWMERAMQEMEGK